MVQASSFHEDLSTRIDEVKPGSERTFGLCIGTVLTVAGILKLTSSDPSLWAVGMLWVLAGAMITAALATPRLLAPLNRAWLRFSLLLSKATNPIAMGVIFFGVITPASLLMRVFGKTPSLRLKQDAASRSYWIIRTPSGPRPDTMKHQF